MKLNFDFGNADCKWFNGIDFGYFRHAIAPLTDSQWSRVAGTASGLPEGYIKVNGLPYAVGDSARRHQIKHRPTGAERYHEMYYGIGLAMAMSQAFDSKSGKVQLRATHAPHDFDYTSDLEHAALGVWQIESHKGEQVFNVTEVKTLDEPLGGFYHFVLNKSGRFSKGTSIEDQTVLVLDVGGHTVDIVAVDEDYVIDISSIDSTRAGVLNLKEQFEKELRYNNKRRFKDTGDIDPRQIEKALMTGVFRFGKLEIDCSNEALEAKQTLVNDVIQIIQSAGGAADYNSVLLTGGGAALIYDMLSESLPYLEFTMVEKTREHMRFANVFGAAKIFTLQEMSRKRRVS